MMPLTRRDLLKSGAAAALSAAALPALSQVASESPAKGSPMKPSMNVLLWTTFATSEHFPILAKLREAGYAGIELPCFQGEEPQYAEVGKEIKRLGMGCSTVTVMTPEANPVSPDPAVRAAAVERLKWAIRCTAAAGGDVLCGPMHSALGIFSGAGPTDDEKKRAADVIRAAADEAKAANVKLAIEFLCRFEAYVLTTAKDAAAMAKQINHPSVGILFDTFHANIEEKDPPKSLEEIARYVNHFHISENDRGTPGKGHVQWPAIFRALRKINYTGWLTIESFGRAMPEIAAATRVWRDLSASPEEVYVDGLRFMQKMWAEAGA
jgi:D-psicose/D-tagatose/L-ribulose 3-epimerase